jgi:peptidoglycan/LPS O-acetylase OafA/YrhL
LTARRALLAVFVVLLVAIAILDYSWIPAYLLLVVVLVGVPYAVIAVSRGQQEWFGREQRRRRRR